VSTNIEPFPSWLKQIPGELYQLDEKPLLGFPPDFPWAAFSSDLANSLQIKDLSITADKIQWLSETELMNGLGDQLKNLSLSISPLAGHICWIMSEQGLSRFMHRLLNPDSKVFAETIDKSFSKAFYQFLAAEVINSFEKMDFDKKLVPVVLKESILPAETCLGIDINIMLANEPIYGRLLLSQEFRRSWAQNYASKQKQLALSSPIADALDVVVHLEAGKVNLKPSEWKHIAIGDFVILDTCSLEPNDDKGRVMLVINGTPFFRAKIKQGTLKILEHPLYHEVDTAMDTPPKKNDDEEFDDADFELDDDKHDENAGEYNEDHDEPNENDKNDAQGDKPSASPTDDEGFNDDDFDIDEDDLSKDENKQIPGQSPLKAKQPAAADTKTTLSNTPLTVDEIPLTIVIEVGRIQMSVKKLLELQPGNMLELDIHPESGVDMVINGKRIARGELLKIGESLGIRISELS
jgi:flagellar motor switch protein FliN/FliY